MHALIELRQIGKQYQLGEEVVRALRSIDLRIDTGEYVALIGPSGSGKSTLMNVIGCLDTPSSGDYWLNQQPVAQLEDDALARIRNQEIGFVFQTFNLIPRMSALENVALPLVYSGYRKRAREARAAEVLRQVGLGDRLRHRPNELSGGQRQRVAVARALVNRPSLLLADEPTGNLDTQTSYEIMDLFDQLHQQGNTIVVVTHEPDIAQRARREVRLRDGELAADEGRTTAPVGRG
jgi:putative ABC transport system ATP-binding protein